VAYIEVLMRYLPGLREIMNKKTSRIEIRIQNLPNSKYEIWSSLIKYIFLIIGVQIKLFY
jgi:hypothetical protein